VYGAESLARCRSLWLLRPFVLAFCLYAARFCRGSASHTTHIMPGDVVDVATASLVYLAPDRVTEDNYKSYMRAYTARYEGFFPWAPLR
jgi:hypothetical protein